MSDSPNNPDGTNTPQTIERPTSPVLTCAECGYKLRGLDRYSHCPECGLWVIVSEKRRPTIWTRLRHISRKTIRRFLLRRALPACIIIALAYLLITGFSASTNEYICQQCGTRETRLTYSFALGRQGPVIMTYIRKRTPGQDFPITEFLDPTGQCPHDWTTTSSLNYLATNSPNDTFALKLERAMFHSHNIDAMFDTCEDWLSTTDSSPGNTSFVRRGHCHESDAIFIQCETTGPSTAVTTYYYDKDTHQPLALSHSTQPSPAAPKLILWWPFRLEYEELITEEEHTNTPTTNQ